MMTVHSFGIVLSSVLLLLIYPLLDTKLNVNCIVSAIEHNNNNNNNNDSFSESTTTTTSTTRRDSTTNKQQQQEDLEGQIAIFSSSTSSTKNHNTVNGNQHHHSSRGLAAVFDTTVAASGNDDDDDNNGCLRATANCSTIDECISCYRTLNEQEIEWAGVSATTSCDTVLSSIHTKRYCLSIPEQSTSLLNDIFCKVFVSCIKQPQSQQQQQQQQDYQDSTTTSTTSTTTNTTTSETTWQLIDCASLTECNWPGMKERYLGDGKCNDYTIATDHTYGGCYNTPICQYDHGDCCPDTCQSTNTELFESECGSSGGYACRDPNSIVCTSSPSPSSPSSSNQFVDNKTTPCLAYESTTGKTSSSTSTSTSSSLTQTCPSDQDVPYPLQMYDSFGDGWGKARLIITKNWTINQQTSNKNNEIDDTVGQVVYNGTLLSGAEGYDTICLNPNESTCYIVQLYGRIWGRDISWRISADRTGVSIKSLARGSAPTLCQFPLGPDPDLYTNCPNTCNDLDNGNVNPHTAIDSTTVIDEIQLKDMSNCIDAKCFVQEAACNADPACAKCFQSTIPSYCYTIDTFTALTDCTMCKCTDLSTLHYCATKVTITNTNDGIVTPPEICSASMKRTGGMAVMTYSTCMSLDAYDIILRYYDEDNFGLLDIFESCAAEFYSGPETGSGMACMQHLYNAIDPNNNKMSNDVSSMNNNNFDASSSMSSKQYPKIISELAKQIYYDGENFCKCTEHVYNMTPSCPTFINFKTLLYEAMDACHALDNIDCDAWKEFAIPCMAKLQNTFTTAPIDFTTTQCKYIEDTCGGSGHFPMNRSLHECKDLLGTTVWEFYNNYSTKCRSTYTETINRSPISNNIIPTIDNGDNDTSDPQQQEVVDTTKTIVAEKRPYIPPEKRGQGSTMASLTSSSSSQEGVDSTSNMTESMNNGGKGTKFPFVLVLVLGSVAFVAYKQRDTIRTYYHSTVRYRRVQYDGNFDNSNNTGSWYTLNNRTSWNDGNLMPDGDGIALSTSTLR